MPSFFRLPSSGRLNRRCGRGEPYHVEEACLKISAYCFRCISRMAGQPFETCIVDVTTQLRQCIFYNVEVLVLRIDVPLRVKKEVGRTHICGHIRRMKLLYLWKCIAGDSECEIIVELVVIRLCCFLARRMKCGVSRNGSLLQRVRAWWSCRLAL